MKLKYIFASIVAALALAVGCQKEADNYLKEVQVSSSYLGFPAEGGSIDITVTATESWSIPTIPEWITATPASGSAGETTVRFTAMAAEQTREVSFSITCGEVKQTINAIQVTEAVEPTIMTVMEAVKLIQSDQTLEQTIYVKGIVCQIDEISPSYGNATYYISDDGSKTGKYGSDGQGDGNWLEIYRGAWLNGAKFTKGDEFSVGDEMVVCGVLMSYKGTPETKEKTAYVVSINKSLIGIDYVELLNVEEGKDVTEYPKDGGSIKVHVNLKSTGFHVTIPDEAKSWLHIEDFGPDYVTLTADANEGGDREVTVTLYTEDGGKKYTCQQKFTQKGAIVDATVAEFLAAEVGTVQYRLTGVITSEYTSDKQGQSFYLRDATGEVLVYRLNDYKASGAKVLDVITVVGQRGAYKETAQMVNGVYESHVAVSTVSVAEFLAAEVSTTALYCLKGTITSEYASDKQGQSFYMKDDSGEVLIYRLGDYKASGAKIGDVITVVGQRGAYKDTPQMVSGLYVTHESAGEGGGEGGGGEEGDGKYVQVTADLADWAGTYLIVWDDEAHGTASNKDLGKTTDVTISEGVITASTTVDAAAVTVTAIEGGYSICLNDGKFLTFTTNGNQCTFADAAAPLKIVFGDHGVMISGVDSADNARYLLKNASGDTPYFRGYKSSSFIKEEQWQDAYSCPTLFKYTEEN